MTANSTLLAAEVAVIGATADQTVHRLVPVIQDLQRFRGVACEVDPSHVVSLGEGFGLISRAAGGTLGRHPGSPEGARDLVGELTEHRLHGLGLGDAPGKSELRLGKPGIIRCLHSAVRAGISAIEHAHRIVILRSGQPLEFPLASRALPAEESLRVNRDRHAQSNVAICHGLSRARAHRGYRSPVSTIRAPAIDDETPDRPQRSPVPRQRSAAPSPSPVAAR